MTVRNLSNLTVLPKPPSLATRTAKLSSAMVAPQSLQSCLSLWPTGSVSSPHDLPTIASHAAVNCCTCFWASAVWAASLAVSLRAIRMATTSAAALRAFAGPLAALFAAFSFAFAAYFPGASFGSESAPLRAAAAFAASCRASATALAACFAASCDATAADSASCAACRNEECTVDAAASFSALRLARDGCRTFACCTPITNDAVIFGGGFAFLLLACLEGFTFSSQSTETSFICTFLADPAVGELFAGESELFVGSRLRAFRPAS